MAQPIAQTKTSTTAAKPAPRAAAKPATKPAPAKKPGQATQWRRWGEQFERARDLSGQLLKLAALLPALPGKHLAEAVADLEDEAFEPVLRCLKELDADEVAVPTPPRFSVGDRVSVKKLFVPRYNTFISDADLGDLVILDISPNGKQFLCTPHGKDGAQVHIRVDSHLSKIAED